MKKINKLIATFLLFIMFMNVGESGFVFNVQAAQASGTQVSSRHDKMGGGLLKIHLRRILILYI